MSVFLSLGLLVFILWFWYDSLQAREQATEAGNRACKRVDAQFLDQTVVLKRLRLCRTHRGNMSLCRLYLFDFTLDGEIRREGMIMMVGQRIVDLVLDIDHASVIH